MAMSKLTLTAPPEIISLAEEQAKRENTSISAMFVNFIMAKSKAGTRRGSRPEVGPLTKALTGVVKLPENFNEKEFMRDVFAEKYGLGK